MCLQKKSDRASLQSEMACRGCLIIKTGPKWVWRGLIDLFTMSNWSTNNSSGAITKDNKQLKTILCEVAATIARTPGTYLHALYQRIARRRGKPRAMMAVAHSLLVSIYHMLRDQVSYQALGADYFDQLQAQQSERHYVRRLEALEFQVTLTSAS